uniref:Uncharacterized protein n=1 Tax=viral metagenome TaxID=1070528 RepID=A0A6M3LV26_9ZZZZ
MIYTSLGTQVSQDWMPLALANGIEWSNLRAGKKDRFDNLYRIGDGRRINRSLWFVGAVVGLFYWPPWMGKKRK